MEGVQHAGMGTTFADFRGYLITVRMLSSGTVKRYAAAADSFAAFFGVRPNALAPLAGLSRADVLRYLAARQGQRRAPSRANWNGQLAALRALYRWLREQEVTDVDPSETIEWLKPDDPERVPLSLDEAIALVGVARECSPARCQSRNVTLLQVLLHCGLRVSEVASLTLGQVDLENRVFHRVRAKGDRLLAVKFNDVVAEALEEYLAARAELGPPDTEPALFVSTQHRRMSVRSIEYLVQRLAEQAGIGRTVTPHYLRHTSATLLVDEADAPLHVAQEHLGHSLITTTQRYVHPRRSAHRLAVDRLGDVWKSAAGKKQGGRARPLNRSIQGNA